MAVTILFDGLNQIGYSIAMALEKEKKSFQRVAFDFDNGILHNAKKAGYIDQIASNGLTAAAKADIVIIDQPVDILEEHYKIISEVVRPNTTILDTSSIPVKVGEWAKLYIPKEAAVVSFVSGMNAKYFLDSELNSQAAHADLFVNSSIAIASCSNEHADGEAVATALAKVLGATPVFMDVVEIQVAMVKMQILPRLLSVALVHTVMDQAGWEEARMLGSGNFAKTSFPALGIFEEIQPGLDAKLSEEITLRVLDQYMEVLQELKNQIAAKKSTDFQQTIKEASDGRALWQSMREHNQFSGSPDSEMPKTGEIFQQMFLGGLGKRRKEDND